MSTSTSTSQPQPPPTENPSGMNNDSSSSADADRAADFIRFKYYAAWTFVVASPILIILPPRKLDLHTVAHTGAFLLAANHLVREHTGRGITDTVGARLHRTPGMLQDLPSERAREIQAKLKAARDAQIRDASGHISEELRKANSQQQEPGLTKRIWMGGETAGWRERRLREEQQALEEGKGYGDLIMEHIWEVVNWGKTSSTRDSNGEQEPEK